ILVTKNPDYSYSGPHNIKSIVTIPRLKLGRMGMVKIAVILGLSANLVRTDDKIVFLLGKAENDLLDTIMCFQIDEESELFTGHSIADIPKTIIPSVFEHALSLAIELGNKGKEGKPVGTIFVLGDEEKVMQLSRQMIINPFKGYEPEERNILNPILKETVRELSTVDGAFVIAGNGEVIAAGRYLGASTDDAEIPKGLGSRHIAAAGITALTNAIAVVISESSGDVRIFKNGKILMAIEKPIHKTEE
ncbi:diadenylate cyclase, partial [bacterium]|nr:diadenylate cyclase [bacterium]MBU1916966.1 diadenylate cyclase [bacterium]